ncbi:hypothetical protein [Microlunatus speluncae]|uniref:hypothetical protein n=1 Tax=Microlunatus speluncae TaxID=2594267 RepID=UPI001375ACE4|nr:hypothetical protein [Microlunatus speluncae]
MEAQSYQQNRSSESIGGPVPAPLRGLVVGAVLSIVLLIGLPVKMIIDRDGTLATILVDQPGLDEQAQGIAFVAVILYTAVLHVIDVVLLVWFTIKVWRGRGWARIALTIYLVAASILGLISAGKGIEYLLVVITANLIHMIMLALLWLSPSVRAFFAAHRAAARSRRPAGAPVAGQG